jgi:hypothetical protein
MKPNGKSRSKVSVSPGYVYIQSDGSSYWDDIVAYLKSINAHIVNFQDDLDPETFKNKPPSLVIISERAKNDRLTYQLRGYAIVVLNEEGIPGTVTPSPKNPKMVFVNWPLTADDFLKLSAKLVRLSERKFFRTIVRLFLAGSDVCYMGQSADFSHSGMAFVSHQPFKIGDRLEISMSLPGREESIRFPVKIMRIDIKDDQTKYGAKYVDCDDATLEVINSFMLQS